MQAPSLIEKKNCQRAGTQEFSEHKFSWVFLYIRIEEQNSQHNQNLFLNPLTSTNRRKKFKPQHSKPSKKFNDNSNKFKLGLGKNFKKQKGETAMFVKNLIITLIEPGFLRVEMETLVNIRIIITRTQNNRGNTQANLAEN